MADEIFRIESLRAARVKQAQTAQHVLAAIVLMSDGWTDLTAPKPHHTRLPEAEIVAGVILIIAAIIERFRHNRGLHSPVGWVEIAGAGMLLVEAIERLFEPHTIALRIVSFIPPIIVLAFGIFDVRLQKMPHMKATEDEFTMRMRLIRKKKVKWIDVKGVTADEQNLYFERHDGTTKRFRMRDVKNREAAIDWVMDQCK